MTKYRNRPNGVRFWRPAIAVAVLSTACSGSCDDPVGPETTLTVKVLADADGDGSGTVTVETPDAPVFPWTCTITDGQTAGDGLNEESCSRDYTLAQGTDVAFTAAATTGRFVEWTGGDCSGTQSTCTVEYVPALSGAALTILTRAKFDRAPETVELTVDGHSDAATVLQGLTLDAVAEAKDASGAAFPGATYTWASSNPAVASVSGTSAGTAIVQGEGPGTANVTATVRGVVSNAVSVTVVGPQSAKGVLEGVLYDSDGTTPLDSVYLSGGPVEGSTGSALQGVTGRQIPLSDIVIPPGGYRFETDNGRYVLFSVAVLGSRYVSTPGDTADVFAEQTTHMDLFITRGYHLDMLDTDLGTIEAAAGTSIDLVVSYQVWNRDLCPGCVPSVGIGVDENALAVHRFGIPGVYPGTTETDVSIPITVPAEGGTIYATLITTSTASGIEPGLQQYRDRWSANLQGTTMIPIGVLTVN
jgi:hypothetical protein